MPTTLPMRLHGGVRNNPAPATMSQHIVPVGVKGSPDRPRLRLALDAANAFRCVEAQNSSINEFGKTGLDNFLLIEAVCRTFSLDPAAPRT